MEANNLENLNNKKHSLRYYFKIYRRLIGVYLVTRLSYRADFMIGFLGMFVKTLSGIITLKIIFNNVPQISGWSYYELILFYGFASIATFPIDLLLQNVWNLHKHLIDGTFIKYCLKPLNSMFFYFSEIIEVKAVLQLFISIPLIIIASSKVDLLWSLKNLTICFCYWICSSIIISNIYIMAASLGFWFSNSLSVLNFISQVTRFSQYPISIYNIVLKTILIYVFPIAFISYYPMLVLTGKDHGEKLVLAVFLAVFFSFLTKKIWDEGVNNYTGTGS